jgi:hypothetical protein
MSNDHGEFDKACTESRPQARLETLLTEAERPRQHPFLAWERIGRRRREATSPTWTLPGVTQFHSTEETSEQGPGARACGVGGGKGTDQGEHRAGHRTGERP